MVNVVLEESEDGLLIVHVEVFRWTPSVLKYIYTLWEELQMDAWDEGHSYIAVCTPNPKFAVLIDKDFEYYGPAIEDGKEYNLFIKEIEDYATSSLICS